MNLSRFYIAGVTLAWLLVGLACYYSYTSNFGLVILSIAALRNTLLLNTMLRGVFKQVNKKLQK